jgi:hypothetical protein
MKIVLRELGHHLPYSVLSALVGILLVTGLSALHAAGIGQKLFHVLHPTHMLLSAAATTAMFWKHDRRILRAVGIGFVGAVGICSISDYGLPYLGGLVLGVRMEAHFCFLEHPELVVPFAVLGIVCGLVAGEFVRRSTVYSHSGHVVVSSVASTLFLASFGVALDRAAMIGWMFLIVIVSVMLPCCVSDIVFPLLFVKPEAPSCRCKPESPKVT